MLRSAPPKIHCCVRSNSHSQKFHLFPFRKFWRNSNSCRITHCCSSNCSVNVKMLDTMQRAIRSSIWYVSLIIPKTIRLLSYSNTLMAHTQSQEDETDDNDRLVIDEGMFAADESHDNELPECQGCKKREAQFVCADCQRQWYCSRECQVSATNQSSIRSLCF